MNWRKTGPGAAYDCDPTHETSYRTLSYSTAERSQSPFPLCELHGTRIVDALPPKCVLATANPATTLAQLQGIAWRELGLPEPTADYGSALDLLARFEICNQCTARNIGLPTIKRLRQRKGESQ